MAWNGYNEKIKSITFPELSNTFRRFQVRIFVNSSQSSQICYKYFRSMVLESSLVHVFCIIFCILYEQKLLRDTVREHPFNLNGEGWVYVFLWGEKFMSANLIEKYFLFELCALKKYCFCRKIIMSRQLVAKKSFFRAAKQKQIFWLWKNHAPPLSVKWIFPNK